MSVNPVLLGFRRDQAFMEQVSSWERLPPRPPRHGTPPEALDGGLVDLMHRQGTWPLYTHQAHAVQAALAGDNVVVVTGTASGKTLCYNLPVLQILRNDPSASALYLFPTKALAQDQLAVLNGLIGGLKGQGPALNLYDGDTPAARRSAVRRSGGVVLSNPDMLHAGILPYHSRWASFFANLRVVVLDEMHTYRGVFGSHVANLLRRLRRICSFYGSAPLFICTSATIANPAEHAQRLIEAPVTLIGPGEDGAPRGERHLILVNPPMVNAALGIRQSALDRSVQIAGEFLRAQIQTVVFARSRLTTEWVLTSLRETLAPDVLLAAQLQGYRGGYLPNERRSIERCLREGTVRGVVATNALELGVDIGDLSACVMVGYPGTVASTRQQAGRAGRRLESSAAVLVATPTPLDQYIVAHPRYLLDRSPERALINPDNLVILLNHLKCAAYELPFAAGEGFGSLGDVAELLDFLSQQGFLFRNQQSYHWIADSYPAASVSLRTGSSETVVIQDLSAPDRPEVVGELERESAPLLLYEGAIYPHQGQSYLVERLDWEGCRADVRPVSVEYVTKASSSTLLRVLQVEDSAEVGPLTKQHGRVRVTTQAAAYRKIKRATHETLGWGEIDLPPQEMETTAYWFTLSAGLAEQLEKAGTLPAPIDYGPNWAEQKAGALARDEARCRHCGARERPGRRHDVHHVRPFRTFGYHPGGNDHYLQANALDNLVTLCQACHRQAEGQVRMHSALAGLGSVVRNLAPLYLMCDPHDVSVLSENQPPGGQGPTVTVYERVPAGVGFSRQLYELHLELLVAASELIEACPCLDGCPACVGPSGEVGPETKGATRDMLDAMLEKRSAR